MEQMWVNKHCRWSSDMGNVLKYFKQHVLRYVDHFWPGQLVFIVKTSADATSQARFHRSPAGRSPWWSRPLLCSPPVTAALVASELPTLQRGALVLAKSHVTSSSSRWQWITRSYRGLWTNLNKFQMSFVQEVCLIWKWFYWFVDIYVHTDI